MIENSGFLSDEDELVQISASFSDVEILGRSVTNLYGCATRFGKRWFFKGVAPDSQDVVEAHQRLQKEFDIQVGLDHPGVAHIISIENIDGVGKCIITEWIEGETLAILIDKNLLSRSARFRILKEIIDSVGYLHSQGIVHRDLKPTNIMVRKNGGSSVIIDFGVADTDSHLYQKTPAGTEGYASPRQYRAHTPFTGDDIHALGVIMQQLYPGLSRIALRCRQGRYHTAEELKRGIRRYRRNRRIISWLSAAVMILIGITSLLVYMNSLQKETSALRNNIVAMNDSVSSLRSSSEAVRLALQDSLSIVNESLDKEKRIRLAHEKRQTQIDLLKERLNQCLDRAFADFCKTEDPEDPDNQSFIRLVGRLTDIKRDFFAKEIPFPLSDSEKNELEYSFITHYNNIIEQWNQILKRHRRSKSAD